MSNSIFYCLSSQDYISELIDGCGLSVEEYTTMLDVSSSDLNCLILGEISLSDEIANKLSKHTCTTVKYWMNLQKRYDAATQLSMRSA